MSEFVNVKEFKINPFPKNIKEEVLQNVAVIVSTPKFTVPLCRGLGLEQNFVDRPITVAKTLLTTEVLEAVGKCEPRANILSIDFDVDEKTGKLNPIVEVDIQDEK